MEAETVDTIICANCEAELAATAEICGQCGAATKSTGMSGRGQAKELMNRPWVIVVLILHVGFLGIPIYWMTKYSLAARLLMILTSIVYTVAAVTAIIWILQGIAARLF